MAEVLYVKRVKSLKARLIKEMKPEEIASKLCNMKCLNRREKENLLEVRRRDGGQSHNARLLDILLRKDPNLFVWEKFVDVLEDTGNATLAHLLRHDICEDAVLSEVDKRHLRSHHENFVSGMGTSGVLQILFEADRYFSFIQKQELQLMRMRKDQADYLMKSVVQLGTYRHLHLLKKALQQTGQDPLASYLPVGEGKVTDSISEVNQLLVELESGPVAQETGGDSVLAGLTHQSVVNNFGQNAQLIAEENQQDGAVNLLARKKCDLVEQFRAGPLERLNHHINKDVLSQKQRSEGNSITQYLVDGFRNVTSEINQLLVQLGPGPIITETSEDSVLMAMTQRSYPAGTFHRI